MNGSQLHTFFVYTLSSLGVEDVFLKMESMQNYLAPEVDVMEILPEGVLCGSMDMDPEEGYM